MPYISSVPRLENQDTPPCAPYLALVPDGAGHVDFLYVAGGTDTHIASLGCNDDGTFALEIADAAIISPTIGATDGWSAPTPTSTATWPRCSPRWP